jgi:hypothetical protein
MDQAVEESALESRRHGAPLVVTFAVIIGAGVASWAVLLIGVYYAWHAIRAFLA